MTAAQRDDAATDYKRGSKSKSKSKSSTDAAAACLVDEDNDLLWNQIGGSIDRIDQSLEEISLKANRPGAPAVPRRDKRGKKKKCVLNAHLLPRMPCRKPDEKHRPKIQDGFLIPACVARPVSKSEILTNPVLPSGSCKAAKEAEWARLWAREVGCIKSVRGEMLLVMLDERTAPYIWVESLG